MPDEPQVDQVPETTESVPEVAPETAAEETPAQVATPEAAPVATTPSWQDELAKLDPKEFRQAINKHDKLSGVLGGLIQVEIQRAQQSIQERIKAEADAKAAKEAEERLRQLAQDDPMTFAETWLGEAQKKDLERQLDNLRGSTRQELATAIGRAYTDVPEWQELTEDDHGALAKAVLGKPDDEVIALFNRTALDLVAEKRANRLHEQWKAKDLAKAREAIRQEEAARLLKEIPAPDTTPAKNAPARTNIWAMSDKEFDAHLKSRQ